MNTIDILLDKDFMMHIPKKIGKYSFVRSIGTGSYSVVILVRHSQTRKLFACKVVSRALLVEENMLNRFEQEIRILQSLNHPNIVHVEEIEYSEDFISLIMENCENGELFKQIVQTGALGEDECRRIFQQIILGVQFVHSHNIAHRDIKPENILLDKNMCPKLADFGLCHLTSNNTLLKTPCGSPFYAPPEIITNQKYDGKRADMWSLGVVLFTMATGALPWTEVNQSQLFLQIQEADFHIPSNLNPNLSALIKSMLSLEPDKRPTCEQVLEAKWFTCEETGRDRSSFGIPIRLDRKSQSSVMFSSLVKDKNAAVKSGTFKEPLGGIRNKISVRRRQLPSNTANISTGSFVSPMSSIVRRVPSSGRRKPK